MAGTTSRRGRATSVIALALGVAAAVFALGTGHATAATVTATAAGGPIPDAVEFPSGTDTWGVLTQTFSLAGGKVKGKQVQDLNLTLNTLGSGQFAGLNLRFVLRSPRGENIQFFNPAFFAQSMQNLKIDEQSRVQVCDPFTTSADFCNYVTGGNPTDSFGTGVASGLTNLPAFRPVFRGANPKGTWTLRTYDTIPPGTIISGTSIAGTATLEVKAGKKFAKETTKPAKNGKGGGGK